MSGTRKRYNQPEDMFEPVDDSFALPPVTLRCSHCGNTQPYGRENDPDLPGEVVLIVSNECDQCEAANGGFGSETWFDAKGVVVVPE